MNDLHVVVRDKDTKILHTINIGRIVFTAVGGGLVRNASDLPGGEDSEEDGVLARAVGSEPTPEAAAVMAEEYRRLLDALDDETLKKVAVWRMEGYTEDAIAARLGCARRTVARQLALIRTIWRDAGF